MLESKSKKVSPIPRYKKFNPAVAAIGKDEKEQQYTNNFQEHNRYIDQIEIDHLIKGIGKRYPCENAWVCTSYEPSKISYLYNQGYGQLAQNTFLPCPANAFSFSIHGLIAMSVNTYNHENSTDLVRLYDSENKKHWSFCHVVAPLQQRTLFQEKEELLLKEIIGPANELESMIKAIRGSFTCKHDEGNRINLTPIAKKHYKAHGYIWNKQLSQQRITVLDKVTPNGNIIRITADSGGYGDLIPYVDIKMIGYMQEFKEHAIVPPNISIRSKEDLISLLEKSNEALEWYANEVVPKVDAQWGECPEFYKKVLLEEGIRKIVWA